MCDCGCNSCGTIGNIGVVLNENMVKRDILSQNLRYHVQNQLPLTENTFRYGSDSFLNLWAEARALYLREIIDVSENDVEVLTETDLGNYGMYEGKSVPLDLPMLDEEEGVPHYSSGGKAYKVYVKDPKTGNTKTVRFGSGGLRAKINDKKARNAFAARHKCSEKTDKTKASYWSCRLPRYAKLLGLKSTFTGFW